MKVKVVAKTKPHPSFCDVIMRLAGVLLLLTMISFWLVCGMYAKYAEVANNLDGANVAGMGLVQITESKAVYSNGVYTLDPSRTVGYNEYPTVIPGTSIPKDIRITITKGNDVSCMMYLEVVNDNPDIVANIDMTKWTPSSDYPAQHGGKIYRYNEIAPPHAENVTISYVLKNNEILVKDTFRDYTRPDKNSSAIHMQFYAYLVQVD